ncbi:helix-turn-helix domain-containing protein [Kribbella sp. CA-293567]|uniref:helix-turn-helix domain-containing protein n=1 Tax=Kribbella sp. CA-293567 TaxID=3002436 RepID=UPI0022DDCC06|nr:helix-turn-helix transcriptional regulator [Kribbella sp. CA-293567]WBQ05967.1 helix-turn-helix transcriptional regulator [Kribbella sp. CA-293567]
MSTSPNSSARKVQEALGLRLRNLRKDAGLTGRELAAATGWHFTRISKLEHGVQTPTDADIRTWCGACGAGDQVADLVAQARAIESMYVEYRRRGSSGIKQLMLAFQKTYETAEQFRIYEHNVIPGLFQTPEYIRAMLTFWTRFLNTSIDVDEAVAARLQRQTILYESRRKFTVVLEENALRTWFGTAETMAGQLDRLLSLMNLPNIALGIVPAMLERQGVGSAGFWMFDDKLVTLETPTASIEITQPQEIRLYDRMFDLLRQSAVYGPDARALIIRTQSEMNASN